MQTRFKRPKSASTVYMDEGRIERHIKPLLGRKIARDLTRADVQRAADAIAKGETAGVFRTGKLRGQAKIKGGPIIAARVVELLGGIWTWAEKRGHVSGQSPIKGVDKIKGDPKDRVLVPGELRALGEVLRAEPPLSPAAACLRLIALSGLRREEAAALAWTEIDEAGSCFRLSQSKTGRSIRPVGSAVLSLLHDLPPDVQNLGIPGSRQPRERGS